MNRSRQLASASQQGGVHDRTPWLVPPVLVRWLGPGVITAAGLVMLCWTWATWPHPLVDFGRELYVPWQLAQGKVLYTEIAWFNGPLSQYWNSVCFRLFGASLRTLVICNLAALALLIALLHHILLRVGGRFSAAGGCLVFVTVFAFAHYIRTGNYSYVCPYSHEITHGAILSLAGLACAWLYPRYGLPVLAGSGLCLGLSFLTKAEVFLPGALATIVALALTCWSARLPASRLLAAAGVFGAAVLAPPLAAFAAMCVAMPVREAIIGTLGSWVAAANRELTGLPFYREGMGTLDVRGNLRLMAIWTGWYAAILIPAGVFGLALRKKGAYRAPVAIAVFVGVGLLLWAVRRQIRWGDAPRPLPLIMLICGAVLFGQFLRHRRDPARSQRLVCRISLAAFALALLLKMILCTRIYHYGFVLAMPATLVLVTAMLDWLPAAIERLGGAGSILRAAAAALILGGIVSHLERQNNLMGLKKVQVAPESADSFRADPHGIFVNAAVNEINILAGPGETLAVLPEGVMINYLCRRANPTPYINFMPPEMILFGEERMLEAFKAHPPDWALIVHKDTSEYGPRFFGSDYGQRLYGWVMRNYRPIKLIGAQPLQSDKFGILILRRAG